MNLCWTNLCWYRLGLERGIQDKDKGYRPMYKLTHIPRPSVEIYVRGYYAGYAAGLPLYCNSANAD